MAATSTPDLRPHLSASAIRDVCSRPAVLLALAEAIPAAAAQSLQQRQQAVADGVARALQLALALDRSEDVARTNQVLLEEAAARLWEPIGLESTRVLQRTGPNGLFAYLVVDGAVRREAWRADTQRRREELIDELPADATAEFDRDPVDLTRFRIDVERTAAWTAEKMGIPNDIALGLVSSELSYVEAGRRTGRSSNSLWMAISRLRPEWQGVAARGRAAGLGGGVLVRVTDHVDTAVRRAVRWRLIGGVAAALLLAGTLGALTTASLLEGQASPPRAFNEPPPELSTGPGEGPFGPAGRLLALEAARRLLANAKPAVTTKANADRPAATNQNRANSKDATPASPSTPRNQTPATSLSCGLGSAALACR